VRSVFQRSLEYAQETGYLRGRKMKVVLDTTPILGRGAVKDTYNLLADGIKKLGWALAKKVARTKPEEWAREHGLGHYYGSSVKGEAEIDWSDENARAKFLKSIVADADWRRPGRPWRRSVPGAIKSKRSSKRRSCCPSCSCRTWNGQPKVPALPGSRGRIHA